MVALTSFSTFANEYENKAIGAFEKSEVQKNHNSFNSLEDLLRYCVTHEHNWYTGNSYVGMDGQTYYEYQVVTVTTCYTV